MSFRIILGILLACAPSAGSSETAAVAAPSPDGPLLAVAASFPRNSSKEFLGKLHESAEASGVAAPVRVEYCCTFGDSKAAGRLMSQLGAEKADLLVYLDANSAALLSPSFPVPSVAVVSSRSAFDAGSGGASCPFAPAATVDASPPPRLPSSWLLETTPDALTVSNALAALKPPAPAIGLVCIEKDAGHETFARELQSHSIARNGAPAPRIIRCSLPGASCNNAGAIMAIAERELKELPEGSLLIVLPGNNTLKFPFVFEQYAARKKAGLVSLGDFRASGSLLHIGCSSDTLARACLQILSRTPQPVRQAAPEIVPIVYVATPDADALKSFGREFDPAPVETPQGSLPGGQR